ncbi:MAG: hypothetical protein GX272_02085 [Epulopiscium sp.]|nr:hypothetical protein [Candidatus Epulonipiscium sp.]
MPNTILGLIPLGAKKESVPINQLSVVESNFQVKLKRLIIGAVVVIIGLSMLSDSFLAALIMLVLGANTVITALETVLTIKTTAGSNKTIAFLIFEKAKADLVEEKLNQLIGNRMDDTNVSKQTDRIVEAIQNR